MQVHRRMSVRRLNHQLIAGRVRNPQPPVHDLRQVGGEQVGVKLVQCGTGRFKVAEYQVGVLRLELLYENNLHPRKPVWQVRRDAPSQIGESLLTTFGSGQAISVTDSALHAIRNGQPPLSLLH